jgi:hypothetical protein
MSDNSLLTSQSSPVSEIETSGAIARLSGDAVNAPSPAESALAQKGGKNRKSKKGGKSRKSKKGGKSKKNHKARK